MNKVVLKILLLIIFILFISCNKKFINFGEYLNSNMFSDKEILNNKIYDIENFEYKARIIYGEEGTRFSVYDSPNESKKLFDIKYWEKVIPLEIINLNGIFLAKIKTADNRIGWIESQFIELYK